MFETSGVWIEISILADKRKTLRKMISHSMWGARYIRVSESRAAESDTQMLMIVEDRHICLYPQQIIVVDILLGLTVTLIRAFKTKNVTWSDESHFQLLRASGRVEGWHKSHESTDLTCQQDNGQVGVM